MDLTQQTLGCQKLSYFWADNFPSFAHLDEVDPPVDSEALDERPGHVWTVSEVSLRDNR